MDSSIPASVTATAAHTRVLRRLARRKLSWVAGGGLLLLCVAALVAPLLISQNSLFAISDAIMLPPSAAHWLGTDDLGRSVLPQLIYGTRVSLSVGLLSAAAATLIGVLVGAVAGFAGGLADTLLMRFTEIFQAMPTFILAALFVALAGPGESRVIAVIAVLAWPEAARLVRSEVLRIKHLSYVEAARCLGISEPRILLFEVIPNALAPVIALSTLTAAYAILLEAALSFLGLTSPDVVSWGHILSTGQRFIYQAWWLSVFSGLAIFLTALAFNMFGDCVREALNPRLKDE
jgi:peptide/nickel transport system permease protein